MSTTTMSFLCPTHFIRLWLNTVTKLMKWWEAYETVNWGWEISSPLQSCRWTLLYTAPLPSTTHALHTPHLQALILWYLLTHTYSCKDRQKYTVDSMISETQTLHHYQDKIVVWVKLCISLRLDGFCCHVYHNKHAVRLWNSHKEQQWLSLSHRKQRVCKFCVLLTKLDLLLMWTLSLFTLFHLMSSSASAIITMATRDCLWIKHNCGSK